VQLSRLDAIVARRRELAARYRLRLPGLVTVPDPPYGRSNAQSFWIRLDGADRDEVLAALAAKSISARRGIMAAHLEPAYAGTHQGRLPVTERLTRDSLILPLYHSMTAADQDRVVDALVGVLR
jgi:dTDP-4-amino-4,6-dideoxygalactose transaminase